MVCSLSEALAPDGRSPSQQTSHPGTKDLQVSGFFFVSSFPISVLCYFSQVRSMPVPRLHLPVYFHGPALQDTPNPQYIHTINNRHFFMYLPLYSSVLRNTIKHETNPLFAWMNEIMEPQGTKFSYIYSFLLSIFFSFTCLTSPAFLLLAALCEHHKLPAVLVFSLSFSSSFTPFSSSFSWLLSYP